MPSRIFDSISLRFHRVTGGNISSRTAIFMAKNLASVSNTAEQERMYCALEKKDITHPELRLKVLIAQSWVNRANQKLADHKEHQTGLVDYCQDTSDDLKTAKQSVASEVVKEAMEHTNLLGLKNYLESRGIEKYTIETLHNEIERLEKEKSDENITARFTGEQEPLIGIAMEQDITAQITTLHDNVETMVQVVLDKVEEFKKYFSEDLTNIIYQYESRQKEFDGFAPFLTADINKILEDIKSLQESEGSYENKKDYCRAVENYINLSKLTDGEHYKKMQHFSMTECMMAFNLVER